ncbi:hypothetical protein [uncultured Chryseobacterium sp.]|uniref:hypothetical protein n=1 Tax=uncultured Chryseobacterium sp. TaxID=259322 RepID=UPI0025FACFAB|nr:hypothetical protein [uncultured Chryseobacterium sp.]
MKTLILPFLFLLTLIFSCTPNDNDEILEKNVVSYDVYVAGMENYKACYWKNNIKINLFSPDSTTANKILIENNDVHVLGKTRANFNGSYYYWKNNVRLNLEQYLGIPAGHYYKILDMAVDGNDTYFIGYYDTLSPVAVQKYAFCLWKNGIKTELNTSDNIIYDDSKISVFNHQSYISATILNAGTIESGYYVNSVFHTVPGIIRVCNFAETLSGIQFLYIKNYNYYSMQLSTNTETLIVSNVNLNLNFGKISGEKTSADKYIIGGIMMNNSYYKNNVQTVFPLDPDYDAIQDLFVLDDNVYVIKQKTTPFASKVYINNNETQSIINPANTFVNAFNSVFVVAN